MTEHALPAARTATQVAVAAALVDSVSALWSRIARARSEAADRRALQRLDDVTLRDIGLTRGEISSAVAEVHDRVERTRVHSVAPAYRGV
jgi:uncharacterized protein YjiS (DUF1127 family)